MSLASQTQSLETKDELLRSKWIQGGTNITQDFNTYPNGESNGSEGLPELQTMVSLGWLNELGETGAVFAPVELSTVNYHTSNRGAVATDPLCCTVDDNVGTVINRTNKVTTRTKGVINLNKR